MLFGPDPCTEQSKRISLSFYQCGGSLTYCCGSGSGSGSKDQCLLLMDPVPDSDPDPDADPGPFIFIIDLQDAHKKQIF
jgi:hypothetical protein